MASYGYPKNLQYLTKYLRGYTKNTWKLTSVNSSTVSAGQILTVDLPPNTLIDMDTFTMYGQASTSTSAGFATLPKNIESLLERVEVESTGVALSGNMNYYNQFFNICLDHQAGTDAINKRRVLQNASDALVPAANVVNKPFAIQNWIGFIGSCKPRVLHTGITGNIRVKLTFAMPDVLIRDGTGAGMNYTLSECYFSIDTIKIDDGMFDQTYLGVVEQGGVLEIPYKEIYSFSASHNGLSTTTNFSVPTNSLDRIFGTFVLPHGGYGVSATPDSTIDPTTGNSTYFTRPANGSIVFGDATNVYGLTSWQFSVGGQAYPNFQVPAAYSFAHNMNALNQSQDLAAGVNPKFMDALNTSQYNRNFFCAVQEFCHSDSEYLSGLNTKGGNIQSTWQTIGTQTWPSGGTKNPKSLQSLVFVETTAVLRCGANYQKEKVQ